MYQGSMLTFPDLDNPADAYARMDGGASKGNAPSGPSYDPNSIAKGTDPALLAKNKDWLDASRVMYERTQGASFKGDDKQLADWGLDRMARFSYNLPLMGVDALTIKNAPQDQKDAFMFMLNSFDKISNSWGGTANFLKYMAIDPTNLAGLTTFGIGAAAAGAAKVTTKAGLIATLKTAGVGAIEGGIYGAAQSRIEQEARVNAGGQDAVDYGKVMENTALGAAAGGVLNAGLNVGLNRLRARGEKVPEAPTVNAPEAPPERPMTVQTEMTLPDMNNPELAAQTRMDRFNQDGKAAVPHPEQDLFHITSELDNTQPKLPMDMPLDPGRTPLKEAGLDLAKERMREDGTVMTTADLPHDPNIPEQGKIDMGGPREGPYTYDGQGSLFPTDPTKFGSIRATEIDPKTGEIISTTERSGTGLNMVGDKINPELAKARDEVANLRKRADDLEQGREAFGDTKLPTEQVPGERQPRDYSHLTPTEAAQKAFNNDSMEKIRPREGEGIKDIRRPDDNLSGKSIPKWFNDVESTINQLAEKFDAGKFKLWVGNQAGAQGLAYGNGHIVLAAGLSKQKAATVLIHEFGHQLQYRLFDFAPKEVQDAIRAAHARDTTNPAYKTYQDYGPLTYGISKGGDNPIKKGYNDNFAEWFAEQVSRFISTQKEPVGIVDQFFAKVSNMWKDLYEKVMGHIPLDKEVEKFLKAQWTPTIEKERSLGSLSKKELAGVSDSLKKDAKAKEELIASLRKEADEKELALNTQRKADFDEQMRKATDDALEKTNVSPELQKTNDLIEQKTKFTPEERIGGEKGPSITDLKQLVSDIASGVDTGIFKSWERLRNATDPLRRALINMSANDAKDIIRELKMMAKTDKESQVLLDAVIHAQNNLHTIAMGYGRDLELATTEALKNSIKMKMAEVEKIFSPLKLLAKEAGTVSSHTLNEQKQNLYKTAMRDQSVDSLLRDAGIDPKLASPQDRADKFNDLINKVIGNVQDTIIEKDTRLRDLRRRISDANIDGGDDIGKLWDEMALLKKGLEDERLAGLTSSKRLQEKWFDIANKIGYYSAATVLTPGSVTVNVLSNAFRVFTRPLMEHLARGPFERDSFREMTSTYGAMWRTGRSALDLAIKSFQLNTSLITGSENKWLENHALTLGKAGDNPVIRAIDRNFIQIWLRLLGSTDEFFYKVSYQGFGEGRAVGNAMREATEKGMTAAEREAHVTNSLHNINARLYDTSIDSTVVGQVRMSGIAQGKRGDELNMWVNNEIHNNPDLFKRAKQEEGISITDDLLFKREFSGDGLASGLAKSYEEMVRKHPELRIIGQLFFRTPVRVFEAGMRMTPGVQLIPGTKFISDLRGENGAIRQLRAQSEALFAYGFSTSVITGFATGNITGDGGGLDYRERRRLEESGWKPYSIRVGDSWVSYRNMDPFATPIKIIANAMDRLKRLDYQRAQGDLENKEEYKQIIKMIDVATSSIGMAIRDASLTSGLDEAVKLAGAIFDPEKNESTIMRFAQSKAELAIPNVFRRAQKSFGEGQNVQNEPMTFDQILNGTLNPSSTSVNHLFDALGNRRNIATQGLVAFMGIDIATRNDRERGLSKEDVYSLREIAKMSYATDAKFIPQYKSEKFYPDKDLRVLKTQDGETTIYNRAMEEYNKNMPNYAYSYLKNSENLPMGRPGLKGPRVTGFEKVQQKVWDNALRTVQANDMNSYSLRVQQMQNKQDVMSGRREVAFPFNQ